MHHDAPSTAARRRWLVVTACAVLLLASPSAYGSDGQAGDQQAASPFPTISVDLNAGHTVGTLDFDVPVRLTGNIGDSVNGIGLTVSRLARLPAKPKDAVSQPPLCSTPTTDIVATNTWTRVTGVSGNSFSIVIPPLEPNQYYCLNFVIRRSLTAPEETTFTAAAQKVVRAAFDAPGVENGLTDAAAGELRQNLADGIVAAAAPLEVDFRARSFFDRTLEFADVRARMSAAARPLVNGQRNAILRQRDLNAIVIRHEPQFAGWLAHPTTRQFLLELQAAAASTPEFAKTLEPFQPSIKTVLAWRPTDAARLMAGRPDTGEEPATIDWTGGRVRERLATLRATTTTLQDLRTLITAFIGRPGGTPQTTVSQDALTTAGEAVSGTLAALLSAEDELEGMDRAIADREQGIRTFIDFISVEALGSTTVFATSVAEFSTRHAQYVSMDLGLGFVPAFDQAFSYAGVNLYLRPVNKQAPLKGLQFRRRFALMAGMTLSGNLEKANERSHLLGGRMLVAGAGLRFVDSLRVVGGGIFFLKDDPNPIVNKTEWAWSPFMAVTVDWDVRSTWERLTGAQAPR